MYSANVPDKAESKQQLENTSHCNTFTLLGCKHCKS